MDGLKLKMPHHGLASLIGGLSLVIPRPTRPGLWTPPVRLLEFMKNQNKKRVSLLEWMDLIEKRSSGWEYTLPVVNMQRKQWLPRASKNPRESCDIWQLHAMPTVYAPIHLKYKLRFGIRRKCYSFFFSSFHSKLVSSIKLYLAKGRLSH